MNPAAPSTDALAEWLATPPGQYLLAWEQAQLDRVVADMFGYHALQLSRRLRRHARGRAALTWRRASFP
jgi:hypothetical protein